MATKDLSRTAVERGRVGEYKSLRNDSKASRRAEEREYLSKSIEEMEDAVLPKEKNIGKRGYQTDNLKPLYRFLDKQIGRNWDKVYSDIKERFDIRTLQAYHVVIDHIVKEIAPDTWSPKDLKIPYYGYYNYYRDKQNRLQKVKRENYKFSYPNSRAWNKSAEIVKFLNNRVVGQTGLGSYHWFIPTSHVRLEWKQDSTAWYAGASCGPVFFDGQNSVVPHFRQGAKLTAEELKFWRLQLKEDERTAICKCSPVKYSHDPFLDFFYP